MGRRGGPLVQGRGLQPVRAGIVITGLGREQWGSPAPPPPGLGAGAASFSHKPALLYVCVLGGQGNSFVCFGFPFFFWFALWIAPGWGWGLV